MPRRNQTTRFKRRTFNPAEPRDETLTTTEEMAHSLVMRGLTRPIILEHLPVSSIRGRQR